MAAEFLLHGFSELRNPTVGIQEAQLSPAVHVDFLAQKAKVVADIIGTIPHTRSNQSLIEQQMLRYNVNGAILIAHTLGIINANVDLPGISVGFDPQTPNLIDAIYPYPDKDRPDDQIVIEVPIATVAEEMSMTEGKLRFMFGELALRQGAPRIMYRRATQE